MDDDDNISLASFSTILPAYGEHRQSHRPGSIAPSYRTHNSSSSTLTLTQEVLPVVPATTSERRLADSDFFLENSSGSHYRKRFVESVYDSANTETLRALQRNPRKLQDLSQLELRLVYKLAVRYENVALLERLKLSKLSLRIAAKAYKNHGQLVSFAPLYEEAILSHSTDSMRWLLDNGVDKSTYVPHIDHLLRNGTPSVLALLEEHGAILPMLREPGLVAQAARVKNHALIEVALRHGADVNTRLQRPHMSAYSHSALYYAVQNAECGTVFLLLTAGADMDYEDNRHMTPLHLAVRGALDGSKPHQQILQFLLAKSRSTRVICARTVPTVLDTALIKIDGHRKTKGLQKDLVRCFLERGSIVSFSTLNLIFDRAHAEQGLVLFRLVLQFHPEAIELVDESGSTCLHVLATKVWSTDRRTMALELCKAGANVHAEDIYGKTALQKAAGLDQHMLLDVMLKYGDPNPLDQVGDTPLHL